MAPGIAEDARLQCGGGATYVFWNQHEALEGTYDFSGCRDVGTFLCLCREEGLLVWLRIGPWCHGESRNGGFPDWLMHAGIPLRCNDPAYLAHVRRYWQALYPPGETGAATAMPLGPSDIAAAPSPNYIFTHERNDANVGSDFRRGANVTFDEDAYPYLLSEMGGCRIITLTRRETLLICEAPFIQDGAGRGAPCRSIGAVDPHPEQLPVPGVSHRPGRDS